MKIPSTNDNIGEVSASSSPTGGPERDIDLYGLALGIARRWRMIAGLTGAAILLTLVFVVNTPSRYTSEVRILFGNTESEILSAGRQSFRLSENSDLVRSQVHVLRSRDLLAEVIKDLDLINNTEFVSSNKSISLKKKMLIWLGLANGPRLMSPEERAWKTLAPRLVVYPLPQSRVIALDVWSYDPKLAASIANRLAESYLNETKAAKSRSNREATEWLSSRIENLQEKVRISEAKVERFRAQAGLLRGTTTTLNAQELSGIKSQIIVASANRSQAQARARQIRKLMKSGGNINSSSEILQSQFIRRLREQQVTLRRLVADLSSKYLPSHPRMVRLRAEIEDLSRQVRTEMRKIVSSLQGQVDVANARVDSLNANLDRVKVTVEEANKNRVQLKAFERDAKASSQLLETYMRRFREASARADIETQSPNARIISKAYVSSTPSYPKKGPILILVSAGVFIFAVIIAFLLEIFTIVPVATVSRAKEPAHEKNEPKEPESEEPKSAELELTEPEPTELEQEQQVSPSRLAMACKTIVNKARNIKFPLPAEADLSAETDLKPAEAPETAPVSTAVQAAIVAKLPLISHQNSQKIDIENMLRELIQDNDNYRQGIINLQKFTSGSTPAEGGFKILATSNLHSFDKSMAMLALVRKISSDGHSVLLIDADFQIQNISRSLNLMAFPGLTDLLTGSALFTDVVIQDQNSSAHIIPAGKLAEFDEADVRLAAVVDAFAHAYDYVIIDGGMALPGAPMWSLTSSCDRNLVFMGYKEADEGVEDLVSMIYDHCPLGEVGIVSVTRESLVDVTETLKRFNQSAA